MEEIIWTCSRYTIIKAGRERLYDVIKFVVAQNYIHHSLGIIPKSVYEEIEKIHLEELSYSDDPFCFIVKNYEGEIIGSIRVYRWDKSTLTPMHKIFNISPLEKIKADPDCTFWHIGRFAIDKSKGFPTITLFKQLMNLAIAPICNDKNGYMLAEIDSHLLKVIRSLGI